MTEFLNNLILNSNWFFYGVILAIGIPLIVIILNEVISASKRGVHPLGKSIASFKNVILPFGAGMIILTQMLDFERSNTVIKVMETVLWILVINTIIGLVNSFYVQKGEDGIFKSKIPQLFMDILRVGLVLLGGAIVLSTVWGADLSGLVTALGLGSFVLGLALQDTLGNLFSGIALVYEKPFSEGDVIEVDDKFGTVIEMNWRAIRMETIRGDMLVIPHLMIGQAMLKNYSKPTKAHYMTFEIGFDYHVPPNEIKKILTPICLETPNVVADPPPAVKVIEYKESCVLYEIEFAIEEFMDHEEIMDDLMTRCWYAVKRNRLSIPVNQWIDHFPQRGAPVDPYLEKELKNELRKLNKILPIKRENALKLISAAAIVEYGMDEYIIHQGDQTGDIFIILSGKADLLHNTSEEDIEVANLEIGEVFGEISMFTGRTSMFTVKAITDVKLLVIDSNHVPELVDQNPKLARFLDNMMDQRRSILKELNLESSDLELEEIIEN